MMGGWNDADVARWISWDESSRYFKSLIHDSEVEEAVTVTVPSLEPWDAVEGETHWCIEIPYGLVQNVPERHECRERKHGQTLYTHG